MMALTSIALSGFNAGVKRLEVSADNTARRNVPNSEKNRAIQETVEGGGVTTDVQKVPLKAEEKSTSTDIMNLSTNIDYAEEATQSSLALYSSKASLLFLDKAKSLDDSILNLLA